MSECTLRSAASCAVHIRAVSGSTCVLKSFISSQVRKLHRLQRALTGKVLLYLTVLKLNGYNTYTHD